jgi:hypothetical protein
MRCTFEELSTDRDASGKRAVQCVVCKRIVRAKADLEHVHAECRTRRKRKRRKPGLGDYVKLWLTRWGITREAWLWLKHWGKPPAGAICGCEARQETLNRAGSWVMRWLGR